MSTPQTIDPSSPPDGLLKAGPDQIFALFDRPELAGRAIEALAGGGHNTTGSWVLSGSAGADRLDASGRGHGLRGRLYRFIEHIGDEYEEVLLRSEAHLRSGGTVLRVPATKGEAPSAATVLSANGAFGMAHFDKNHWEPIGASRALA